MLVPTTLPAEPIDLDQSMHKSQKRRNSEVAHFRRESSAKFEPNTETTTEGIHFAEQPGPASQTFEDDENGDFEHHVDLDDTHSAYEDILDSIDINPYVQCQRPHVNYTGDRC